MIVARLTTFDNPFDPFDDPRAWQTWDEQAGYFSANFLARILVDSEELSDADRNLANTLAIDEIVEENVLGMWRKVTREIVDAA